MALRNSAAKLLGGFGLRPQLLASMPSVEVAQSLKAVASRSYAKGAAAGQLDAPISARPSPP